MKKNLHYLFMLVSLFVVSTAWAKDYSGAELYALQEVQYGKFEARMKMAAASGTVCSMFLYQNGSEIADGRPWVEVDIEILGKNPNSFQSNIITGKAGAQKTSEKNHTVSPAADQAFHTYAIEWTPNYVRWTLDGVEVRKTEGGQVSNLTGTQGLRFNLWSSESAEWVGAFDESKLPLFQFINWVKVYKYTPGQGEGGSDFTLDWTDNFDTFDDTRWGKGDWTFDGNRVDLTDKNIYCQDGMMILALAPKGQESFNGSMPLDNFYNQGSTAITDDGTTVTATIDESTQPGGVIPTDVTTAALNYTRTIAGGTDAWTVCLPYTPPTTNLTYYTLESVSGTTLNFKEVASPAAYTPYLVVATADTSVGTESATAVDFSATVQNPAAVDGYEFKGTLRGLDHATSEGNYILQANNIWGIVDNEHPTVYIPPFRAYIERTNSTRSLNTAFDNNTTAINRIHTVGLDGTEQWYDLSGRRIAQPTQKGLYIQNGKKVVMK